MNEEIRKLRKVQEQYLQLRNEKLATGITIKTMIGSFEVNNQQMVTAVLDFLIREVSDQIKQKVDE